MPLQDKSRKQLNLPGRKLEKLLDDVTSITQVNNQNTWDIAQPILKELIQNDIQLILVQPEYSLLEALCKNDALDIFNIQQVSDILFVMATDPHFTDLEAENLYKQCRSLYHYVQNNNTDYSMNIHMKLQQIQMFLGE